MRKWRQNQARAVLDLAGVNQHNNTECLLLRDTLGPYIGERGAERQAHAVTQARQDEGKRQIDALARQLPELRTQFSTALESTREQVAVARERASVTARRALRELDQEPTLRQKGEPVAVQQARLRTHLVVNRELLLLPVPRRWRMAGAWLARGEPLYHIVGQDNELKAEAFIGEQDHAALTAGSSGVFVANLPEFGSVRCATAETDQVNVAGLEQRTLASLYGGPIAVTRSQHNGLAPTTAIFRVRLSHCDSLPLTRELPGTVLLARLRHSLAGDAWTALLGLMQRERGL